MPVLSLQTDSALCGFLRVLPPDEGSVPVCTRGKSWVSIFTAVAMCCFAFSTIIGWGLYGSRCIEFLGGEKLVRPFLVIYSFVSIVGATINLGLLWDIADTFNGLMAVPNLIALLMLSGQVKKLAIEVDQAQKDGTI